jgi:hypothetical protein
MEDFLHEVEKPCCILGYHVYKSIWRAVVGEVLPCEREVNNVTDRYAVSVVKDCTTGPIGHLPRKASKVCSLFIRRGGTIQCRVTGTKRYSSQGDHAI